MENMLNLFSMFCSYIVSGNFIRFHHPDIAEQVVHWAEAHISEPLLLAKAADYLGYSESTISHTIKERLNMSFKRLCILKKIEQFETIITENPTLSIEEAASAVGYSDASYFSRLYKKIRRNSPSAFVNEVRRGVPASRNTSTAGIDIEEHFGIL
jgi:AraC-like DNA-binding protein